MEMAVACDFRLIAPPHSWAQPEGPFGLAPRNGIQQLVKLMARTHALDYALDRERNNRRRSSTFLWLVQFLSVH